MPFCKCFSYPLPGRLFLLFLKAASWEDELPLGVKDSCHVILTTSVWSPEPTGRWKKSTGSTNLSSDLCTTYDYTWSMCAHTSHITLIIKLNKIFHKLKIVFKNTASQVWNSSKPSEVARTTGVHHQGQLYFHVYVLLTTFKEIFLFKKRQQIESAQIITSQSWSWGI